MINLGFKERVKGSHHIFTKERVEEIINIQPKGNLAKPYQVKQVRGLIVKYNCLRMKEIKYEIIIYWSKEDEAYIAEVPELPGCMADGETYEEALQNSYTIVKEWLETAQRENRSIPEPKGKLSYA
ncbi:MAG: hypothetical protein Tsb0034_14110 [Ekhidna sp.]